MATSFNDVVFDIDTQELAHHTERVSILAKELRLGQQTIRKNQEKAKSKKLSSCKEKYNERLHELKEAIRKINSIKLWTNDDDDYEEKDSGGGTGHDDDNDNNDDGSSVLKSWEERCLACRRKKDRLLQFEIQLSKTCETNKMLEQQLCTRKTEITLMEEENEQLQQKVTEKMLILNFRERTARSKSEFHCREERLEQHLEMFQKQKEHLKQENDYLQMQYLTGKEKLEQRLEHLKNENECLQEKQFENESKQSEKLPEKQSNLRNKIPDLSDHKRPTIIAEEMSEMYDNQWKDAYGYLKGHLEDVKIIDALLSALMTVYKECHRMASASFFERVQDSIMFPKEVFRPTTRQVALPDGLKQQIKEFRRIHADQVLTEIEQVVTPKVSIPNIDTKEIKAYLSRCVEICWLCVVQNPPLVPKTTSSAEFDTTTFKDYTRSGRFTEYVVWPALLLHETGTLLAKGVAQGFDSPPEISNISTTNNPGDIQTVYVQSRTGGKEKPDYGKKKKSE